MPITAWQKFGGILLYLLPWSDAIPFGRYLFIDFPFLQWLALPTIPILFLEQSIPFGSLLLFFVLFLGVVRNVNLPHFLRFNALQALLIDIGIIIINYAFTVIIQPFGRGIIVSTLSSTVLIAILTIVIFAVWECLQGKEPEIPPISEAVRMQL